jgi:hypothetical protein
MTPDPRSCITCDAHARREDAAVKLAVEKFGITDKRLAAALVW